MAENIELYNKVVDMIVEIADIHKQSEHSIYQQTAEQEQAVIDNINVLIGEGMIELYPLKALLASSNNWSTFLIVRISIFRDILLEGVNKGCLEADKSLAWDWVDVAAVNNDPTDFMDEMEQYYDLLATAAEDGNTIALDIMNTIWEPEQIIEED